MKLITKTGLLISLLAIPVLIYIFLQLFGENYYSIPVYYQKGFEAGELNCNPSSGQHYVNLIHEVKPERTNFTLNEKITVFSFLNEDCNQDCQEKFNQLSRLTGIFNESDSVQVLSFVLKDSVTNNNNNFVDQLNNNRESKAWQFIQVKENEIREFYQCELLLASDTLPGDNYSDRFVLIDKKSRIRGYYDALSLEEVDRLILEIRILLYEYEYQS